MSDSGDTAFTVVKVWFGFWTVVIAGGTLVVLAVQEVASFMWAVIP